MKNKKSMIEKKFQHKISEPIFVFALSLLLLFSSIQPHQKISAQTSPDTNEHKVYLPLVINGSGTLQNDVCDQSNEEWLCRLNQFRQMTNLPSVTPNSTMSAAVEKHDQYLVLNGDKIQAGLITNFHQEDPNNPGYTPEGCEAGGQSNIVWYPSTGYSIQEAIEIWMTFASHRYGMLHPDFSSSGFDLTCTDQYCASSLNVTGSLPASYEFSEANISYPLDGQTGLATATQITWAFYRPWLGEKTDANEVYFVSGSIFDQSGNQVAFTVSEPNHTNGVDDYKNQIALMPTADLQNNHTYRVSLTVRYLGQNYTKNWSFTTK